MVTADPDFSSGDQLIGSDRPFSWRRRIISRWGMVYTVAGNGMIALGDASYTTQVGDLLLCAPGIEHGFTGYPGWRYLWFHLIPPDRVDLPEAPEPVPGVIVLHFSNLKDRQRVLRDLLEAHELEFQRLPGWHALATALLQCVLLRARRLQKPDSNPGQLRLALRLLSETARISSIDEIAQRCGMSRAVFYRFFQKHTGCTPREYREHQILRYAQNLLLENSLSISEIAERLGFSDRYYFSNRFRKFFGQSPRQFRRGLVEPSTGKSK